MKIVALIFRIAALLFSAALVVFGITCIVVLSTYKTNEQLYALVSRLIENYGLLNSNSFLVSVFSFSTVDDVVTFVASFGLAFGIVAIPCTVSCLNAVIRQTRGRFVACIVTGAIGGNVVAIVSAIINLIALKRNEY